jgi:hypothetical protein
MVSKNLRPSKIKRTKASLTSKSSNPSRVQEVTRPVEVVNVEDNNDDDMHRPDALLNYVVGRRRGTRSVEEEGHEKDDDDDENDDDYGDDQEEDSEDEDEDEDEYRGHGHYRGPFEVEDADRYDEGNEYTSFFASATTPSMVAPTLDDNKDELAEIDDEEAPETGPATGLSALDDARQALLRRSCYFYSCF